MGFELDCVEHESDTKNRPVFTATYCSQCGGKFGPGRSGYSDCRDHQDWLTAEEESEANAWRGCLGERTL